MATTEKTVKPKDESVVKPEPKAEKVKKPKRPQTVKDLCDSGDFSKKKIRLFGEVLPVEDVEYLSGNVYVVTVLDAEDNEKLVKVSHEHEVLGG